MKKETLVISFHAKRENVRITRAVVRNFLLLRGIFEQDIFDTELALDEAVANVIEHTYKFDESKIITLTLLWDSDGVLEILIRDFGPKVDPSKIKSRPLEELKEGGLGVYIMKKIFDVVEWKDVEKGNLLYLKKTYSIPSRKEEGN